MNTTTEGFWTTHREIEFLETLSSNLQRKYLATMHKRHNWGSIDPIEVEMYLRLKESPVLVRECGEGIAW